MDRGRPRLRSVHRERAGRVNQLRKRKVREPTPLTWRKAIPTRRDARRGGPAGVHERGMYVRVLQEPGRSRSLHREIAGWGNPLTKPRSAAVALVVAGETNTERCGGTSERRQRSEEGRGARRRSSSIVPEKRGNAPQADPVEGRGESGCGTAGGKDVRDIGPE